MVSEGAGRNVKISSCCSDFRTSFYCYNGCMHLLVTPLANLAFCGSCDGLAIISSAYLAVRFGYHEDSIYVEREVLKDDGNVEYTISQLSSVVTGQKTWSLEKGTYKVFGLSRMQMEASTQQVTPTNFTTSIVHALVRIHTASIGDIPPASTQREPQSPIFIGDSDDDFPVEDITTSTLALFSTPLASGVHEPRLATPTFGARPPLHPQILFRTSAVACLKRLAHRPNTKNVLKNMDYASVLHRIVDFLPSIYNGDIIFELPPVAAGATSLKAKSLQGMDKKYDGHCWCLTKTSNISNDMGLTFRRSSCAGHLRCGNLECDYLKRSNRENLIMRRSGKGQLPLPSCWGRGTCRNCPPYVARYARFHLRPLLHVTLLFTMSLDRRV